MQIFLKNSLLNKVPADGIEEYMSSFQFLVEVTRLPVPQISSSIHLLNTVWNSLFCILHFTAAGDLLLGITKLKRL